MRKLLPLILILGLALFHTGCSSDEKPADSESAAAAADDDLNSETKSADNKADKGGDDLAGDAGAKGDGLDGGGDLKDDSAAIDNKAGGDGLDNPDKGAGQAKNGDDKLDDGLDSLDDAALADIDKDLPPDDGMGAPKSADAGPTEPPKDANPPPAVADNGAAGTPPGDAGATPPADGFGSGAPVADGGTPPPDIKSDAPPKVVAPLQKIKDAAFEKNGVTLNTVYIARPGDKWKKVAKKIYNSDRSKDLKKWNSAIAGRELKPGDKVYYNSPNPDRANDSTGMVTFYEDNGVEPESYTATAGESLKDVAKQLLGSKDGWKELWVTNAIESKSKLADGDTLKYWKDSEIAPKPKEPPKMAELPPPPRPAPLPPAPPPVNPPPAPLNTQNPTGVNAAASATNPQKPPDQGVPPPPPPPVADAKPSSKKTSKKQQDEGFMGLDQDSMLMLGAGGMFIVAAAVILARMKKAKARRLAESQTQI